MKQGALIWILAVIIFGGILIFFMNLSPENRFDWNENYAHNSNQPYGAEVFYKLLDSYFPENDVERNDVLLDVQDLLNDSSSHKTYLFIGEEQFLKPSEVDALFKFIERGNTAMIIAKQPAYPILSELLVDSIFTTEPLLKTITRESVNAQFYDPALQNSNKYNFHYQKINLKSDYQFSYFSNVFLRQNQAITPLGAIDENNVNFITAPVGKGRVFVHTNPLFFTNYHLIESQGAKYAESVLSYLKPSDIIWDSYAQNWKPGTDSGLLNQNQSPLSFILNNPPLYWALLILLVTGLLYVLFAFKRIQRVVPVIEPKKNSSLEFIKTISRLYFIEREHPTMVRHQMRYFLSWIREKYRIHASELDDQTIDKLHVKSGVSKEIIQDIRDEYQKVRVYAVLDDKIAIKFHQSLTRFYKNCK